MGHVFSIRMSRCPPLEGGRALFYHVPLPSAREFDETTAPRREPQP